MASIHTTPSLAAAYSRPMEHAYPAIPFSALTLAHTRSAAQLATLQNALHAAWNASPAAPQAHLDLGDTGLVRIESAARLIPRSVSAVSLADNPLLHMLPNDLPDGLRSLSVRNVSGLQRLPDSLPGGLRMEVGGSGLTPEYLRFWTQRHPRAGVVFTEGGHPIELGQGSAPSGGVRHERANWAARLERDGNAGGPRPAPSVPAAPEDAGITLADYTFDSDSHGDSDSAAGSDAGTGPERMSEYAEFTMDELERALAMSLEPPQPDGGGAAQFDAAIRPAVPAQETIAAGPEAHAAAMADCEHYVAHQMAFWLSEDGQQTEAARDLVRQCGSHLYALEDEDGQGSKRRSPNEIVADHYGRLNEFAQILDRIKRTASFSQGAPEAQARQRRRVADMLHLMASDKELCGTVLVAMKVAASSCPDALATEGLEMMEAMCTTARSIRENWTPEQFYQKMEQQLKREKVRAQVVEIVKRMKKDYRAALMEAIQRDHRALHMTLLGQPPRKLSRLVGERYHTVKRDGSIAVRYPDPGESASYAATKEGRKTYVKLQAEKKVDDIEVLSLCQNDMQSRGLLADVQAGIYTYMHRENYYSDALNVTPAELSAMARKLSLSRAEVLARMTTWDHWTDFMDRNGHSDAVRDDPQLRRDEAELAAQMDALRETLDDFTSDHALEHPEAGQDFALLNNLITAVGTPVVSQHELLRRGGENAHAITFADKEKHLAEGVARLAQLEAEAGAAAPNTPAPRRTSTAGAPRDARPSRGERDGGGDGERHHHRHRASRHGRHGERPREHGADRGADRDTAATPAAAPEPAFEASRLALFKSAVDRLKAQGESPYQAALLRKTEELVTPFLPAAPARTRHRHTR